MKLKQKNIITNKDKPEVSQQKLTEVSMIRYAETHEWIDDKGRVGIAKKALEELGEIVYIELPEVGQEVKAGEEIAVLESTKAAVDLYSPVSGKITAINEKVKENPSLLNQSPEGEGYLFEMTPSLPHELDSLTLEG